MRNRIYVNHHVFRVTHAKRFPSVSAEIKMQLGYRPYPCHGSPFWSAVCPQLPARPALFA